MVRSIANDITFIEELLASIEYDSVMMCRLLLMFFFSLWGKKDEAPEKISR